MTGGAEAFEALLAAPRGAPVALLHDGHPFAITADTDADRLSVGSVEPRGRNGRPVPQVKQFDALSAVATGEAGQSALAEGRSPSCLAGAFQGPIDAMQGAQIPLAASRQAQDSGEHQQPATVCCSALG